MLNDMNLVDNNKLWGDDSKKVKILTESLSFYENGYIKINNAIPDGLCNKVIAEYNSWCDEHKANLHGVRSDGRNPRIINLHNQLDSIKDLFVSNDHVLNLVDTLFGYKASVYTSLTFQYGTEQPLHRDTPVFVTAPERFYFGMWFALEDADTSNGCLEVVPKSHKIEEDDRYKFAEDRVLNVDDIDSSCGALWHPWQMSQLNKCINAGLDVVQVPAKRGDCIIWHPQMFHSGSKIINKSKTRYSVVFHVTPENFPVYQGDVYFNRAKAAPPQSWGRTYSNYKDRLFLNVGLPLVGSN